MKNFWQTENLQSPPEAPLPIRAHHLLCLQVYQGYGYDSRFTTNLSRIQQHFFNHAPQLRVELIANKDIICTSCPHTGEHGCNKDQTALSRIRVMDLNIINQLKLSEGSIQSAETLLKLINSTFQHRRHLWGICDNCTWQAQCLWYQHLKTD